MDFSVIQHDKIFIINTMHFSDEQRQRWAGSRHLFLLGPLLYDRHCNRSLSVASSVSTLSLGHLTFTGSHVSQLTLQLSSTLQKLHSESCVAAATLTLAAAAVGLQNDKC